MSRVFDFMVVAVVMLIAIVMHYFGIEMFQPGSPLYEMAATGTENVNGQELADLWFQIATVWMEVIAIAAIWVWALLREYRRQTVTRARRPV